MGESRAHLNCFRFYLTFSERNAHQQCAASAGLLCRLFSAVTYLTIDEMQMIAKKVTYSYDYRAVGAKGASGTFDHRDLKGSHI